VVFNYLHDSFCMVPNGCVFMEVLGKVGCVAVVFESSFVFFLVCVEAPSSLAHVCLVAFLACEFEYARTGGFVWGRFLDRE
jgi:ABC-type uncharacterized transport system permease subunit